MRIEKREVYIADDGQVFDTAKACQAHEIAVIANAKRIAQLKAYKVVSNFDSTEGRGYYHHTYIITDASFAVVLEYCFDRFGKPLSQWYGDGYYAEWHIDQFAPGAQVALDQSTCSHLGVGSTLAKVDVVFLSDQDIDHPRLPARVFPWPKPKKDSKQ